jgi:hypothetical protein
MEQPSKEILCQHKSLNQVSKGEGKYLIVCKSCRKEMGIFKPFEEPDYSLKYCTMCKVQKKIDNFYQKQDGSYYGSCKDCRKCYYVPKSKLKVELELEKRDPEADYQLERMKKYEEEAKRLEKTVEEHMKSPDYVPRKGKKEKK